MMPQGPQLSPKSWGLWLRKIRATIRLPMRGMRLATPAARCGALASTSKDAGALAAEGTVTIAHDASTILAGEARLEARADNGKFLNGKLGLDCRDH
jgi:hypothetical protein